MQTDFLNKTCRKGLKQKNEHRHRILHIRNSPGTKFQLEIKILNFCTKLINRKIVFLI